MERTAYQDLINWKNKKNRKPLILNGARQVGKTWLLKKFGENEYESFAYINCDDTPEMKIIFSAFNSLSQVQESRRYDGLYIILSDLHVLHH